MVREQVDAGALALHGWHYVIEDGEVHVFDVKPVRLCQHRRPATAARGLIKFMLMRFGPRLDGGLKQARTLRVRRFDHEHALQRLPRKRAALWWT